MHFLGKLFGNLLQNLNKFVEEGAEIDEEGYWESYETRHRWTKKDTHNNTNSLENGSNINEFFLVKNKRKPTVKRTEKQENKFQ